MEYIDTMPTDLFLLLVMSIAGITALIGEL